MSDLRDKLPEPWKNPTPRDPARIESVLAEVRRIWMTYPDQRLFQVLMNAWGNAGDPYNVEDDELLEKLRTYGR